MAGAGPRSGSRGGTCWEAPPDARTGAWGWDPGGRSCAGGQDPAPRREGHRPLPSPGDTGACPTPTWAGPGAGSQTRTRVPAALSRARPRTLSSGGTWGASPQRWRGRRSRGQGPACTGGDAPGAAPGSCPPGWAHRGLGRSRHHPQGRLAPRTAARRGGVPPARARGSGLAGPARARGRPRGGLQPPAVPAARRAGRWWRARAAGSCSSRPRRRGLAAAGCRGGAWGLPGAVGGGGGGGGSCARRRGRRAAALGR